MSVQLSKRKMLFGLYTLGAVLLVVTGVLSWDHHTTDPQRVFWGTVDQGMKTSGVTVEATQSGTGSSLHQTVQYSMGGQNTTHVMAALTQSGTSIVDEMIGTSTNDYTRYTAIKTDQKTPSGKAMNFSKILGIWAKADNAAGESQLIPQAILGTNLPLGGVAIPLASLSPADRTKLANQIKSDKVYTISYKDVVRTHKDGRLLYSYKVSVNPQKYAAMMKQFGTVTGVHALDTLKPEQYAGQPSFVLNMTIDARAHRLLSAASEDGSVMQTYTGYDIPVVVKLPAQTVSSTELQKRLQQAQQ